jgi:hypothetical protein
VRGRLMVSGDEFVVEVRHNTPPRLAERADCRIWARLRHVESAVHEAFLCFYGAFPNCDALRHALSWTYYRTLLRLDDPQARTWYMREAAEQNWSSRALVGQIGTLYYERSSTWASISLSWRNQRRCYKSYLAMMVHERQSRSEGTGSGNSHQRQLKCVRCDPREFNNLLRTLAN